MTQVKNIFILGSGRSGTSMLAGLFRDCQINLGENSYQPRESNPKGFFEDREINAINEELLKPYLPERQSRNGVLYNADSPVNGQRWLARIPLSENISLTPDIEPNLLALVKRSPFCYKDPRFCYTLHLWREFAGPSKFICIFRNPAEVVSSILKEVTSMPYLKNLALSVDQAYEVWKLMYLRILEIHSKTGEWLFVDYKQLFTSEGLSRVERFSGLPIDRSFPDKKLNRSPALEHIDNEALRLYSILSEKSG